MSRIDKLSILGIRSFDNQRPETLQFFTPLTLIVGYNGSGKTTIIECLKYATTGELPPNSKTGGAFIHDPKLCGEREVFAQVRLKFNSTTGAVMVATRNIQLQVKKTTRSFKTLEGNLLTVKNGERSSVSARVAELDQMLPNYLGVSKAILDNVIFCHQDESLWPLSEPGTLKRKFDEIFEAMKYTKAIENIKQIRKKQNEELGKYKIMEAHAKEDKDRADKAEKKLLDLQREQEILRHEQEELHKEAAAIGEQAKVAWNNVARFTMVVESLKMAKRNREFHEEQVHDLKKDLEVLPESDEYLTGELRQFEDRVQIQKQRSSEQEKRYGEMQKEIQSTREKHGAKRMDVGRHEQSEVAHVIKMKERENAIRKAADKHNIRGYDMDLDDTQVNEFIDRISKLSKEQNARVDRLRHEHVAEVQKVQDVLDELRERRTTLNENRRSAKERIEANNRKIDAAHADVQKLSADEVGRANITESITELGTNITAAKRALTSSKAELQIVEANRTLQTLEDEASLLDRNLIEQTRHVSEHARLEHLQKEAKVRQRSLQTIKGAHGIRLASLLGKDPDESSLEIDFQSIIESKKSSALESQKERDKIARELEQDEYRLKTARADFKKKQSEADTCASRIREVVQDSPKSFLDALKTAENNRDEAKSNVEGFANMQEYFGKAIEVAESKHACRLCLRAFKDAEAAHQFAQRLMKQTSQKQLEESQKDLKEFEEELRQLKEVAPSHDAWKRITEVEMPILEREIAGTEDKRKQVLQRLEGQDVVVQKFEDSRRDAEGFAKPVSTIIKCYAELKDYEQQIQDIAQKHGDNEDFTSLDDLHEQISKTKDKIRDQRQKIAKLQTDEQNQKNQINSLEMDLSSAKARLASADFELEKKTRIELQINDLKASNEDQRDVMTAIDVELENLGPRWNEETARRDDLKERNEAQESQVQHEASDLMDTLREIQRVNTEARRYIDEGGPAQLTKSRCEVESLQQQLVGLEAELKEITVEINKIREELGSQDKKKRIISDNLKYREACHKLAAVEEEVDRLQTQNAEADQQRHRNDAERLQQEHQELLAQETSKVERMKVKDDQIVQLIADWESEYKDAAPKYKKTHIQVETTKAAVEDLGRYSAALDRAIMKYHTIKMEEINRIVEELWKRTYQGTDVDTILIRSDNETQKGNRSYNYRVCMIKQDAEMDMRGRCSAGQKVLASIIIRLALAECFGVNCGLIALDEPTTNLDRDNIGSLAESLNHIIRQRQGQKNFQLIVITHDEDFLRAIKPQDFCDHYWRVSRNDQQKSIIERQNIALVM